MTRKEQFLAQRTLDDFVRGPPAPEKRPRLEASLDELGLVKDPPKTETRGRPTGSTKYVVRVMPPDVVTKVLTLIKSVNEDADTMRRLVTHYNEFKLMNSIVRPDVALFAFVVDIGTQGLKASTCKSYTRLILEGSARSGTKISGPLVADLMKVLNMMEAEDDVEHAVDVPLDVLEGILAGLPSGRFRLTFFVLLYIGCRAADGQRLTAGAFRIEPDGSLRIHFRLTKNHRRRQEAYTICVKPPCLIPELVDLIRASPESPCPTLSCDVFNREVKEITGYVTGMTTYTLRRAFIHAVIQRNTKGNVTEWLEVARLTGHHQLEVLRTSYTPSIFDATL